MHANRPVGGPEVLLVVSRPRMLFQVLILYQSITVLWYHCRYVRTLHKKSVAFVVLTKD